ncbi:MAG: bifunctional (p)ppGpp synthetase/guanosine-3',5'-bis(diphosphate) 3'-pyrophosphohydrolase [Lachnospiraceae bacterium]|nr:bifunctional (p)ppGpp synthetase/guanosine-3',5'-bis(diphosphate) 3'-pyrophosphohydrolase [Lachnospiraceae bacterium]
MAETYESRIPEKPVSEEVPESLLEEFIEPEMEFSKPADFTTPEELYRELTDTIRRYHPSDDISLIEKAYQAAVEAHKDQKRKSGEPYIIHPLNVALILAELELDKESIAAGLLHDVLEDTVMNYEDLRRNFGDDVAALVDGVTKLTQTDWNMDATEIQAENLRKMFMAMARDIRVILVKLADRLHNMRTAQFWSPETRQRKARETMEIFSPVASRLGISKIKIELDDRSLAILHPEVFRSLTEQLALNRTEREHFIAERIQEIRERLPKEGVKAELSGRAKHLFSIYKKMVQQHKDLDQIYDIFAIRILVDNVIDCYSALGVVHEMYTPLPGRFKDYIAMPKPNRYQSLHTTVMGPSGTPFEIQIRTFEMHRTAEYGIAAHWKYKEQGSVKAGENEEEAKLLWLRSIMDWQTSDSREFADLIKEDLDLFSGYVYCFTPRGEVKTLPAGSNTVDFAYAIHSAVGNRMVGAKVNGTLVPIEYVVQNGDRIEILTSQNSKGPSMDWLKTVKSSQAKSKINAWFKTQNREDNITRGKDAVAAYIKAHGLNSADLMKPAYMNAALQKYRHPDWESLLASIGHGGLKEGQVVNKLLDEYRKENREKMTDEDLLKSIEENGKVRKTSGKNAHGITVNGLSDLSVRFSRCCNPVPGDEIVGYVTRGRGISIHRTDCANILSLPDHEKARLMPAEWSGTEESGTNGRYATEIQIFCHNRIGLFADISRMLTENNIDILAASSRVNKQGVATIEMSFDVGSVEELQGLITRLLSVHGVIDIVRTAG